MSRPLCVNCNAPVRLDDSLHRSSLSSSGADWPPPHLLRVAAAGDCGRDESPAEAAGCRQAPAKAPAGEPGSTLGAFAETQGNLFDIICSSDAAPLRRPMCAECADRLVDSMDAYLKTLEEECREYKAVLKRITDGGALTSDPSVGRGQLATLRAERAALEAELRQLREQEDAVDAQIAAESEVEHRLKGEEDKLWHNCRDMTRQLLDLDADERSARNELRHLMDQYERLARTNALNALFHIWPADHFGTINGFRLGRLPDEPVKWAEVNTALGHVALLLQSLSLSMGVTFRVYEPVPRGARSQIAQLPAAAAAGGGGRQDLSSRHLPLYYDGAGFKLALGQSKFDQALVALVHCVGQLRDAIAEQKGLQPDCVLPHAMERDKIVDGATSYSVQLHMNSEERWTKAMKCLLINLKYALAHVAAKSDE